MISDVDDSFCDKTMSKLSGCLTFFNFRLCRLARLVYTNLKVLISTTDKPRIILNSSIKSARTVLLSSDYKFNFFSLILYGNLASPGAIRVKHLYFLYFL